VSPPAHASPIQDTGHDLLAALDGGTGPPEPPIRAVLFGLARFAQHGHSLAATHEVDSAGDAAAAFFPRLQDNIDTLRRARLLLEQQSREGLHLGPAGHWLLDNANLLDEQLQKVRLSLPRNFFRLLPRLRDEPLAGLPRIYGVAWAWVAHTDSGLDLQLLDTYLRAYQQTRALTLAELWALPGTLRVVLLENLRRLAERTALLQVARDAAHQWLDRPQDQRADSLQDSVLDAELARLGRRGAADAFLLQLQQRADDLPATQARLLQAWLSLHLPDSNSVQARQQSEAAEDHQSIRNAITTLRALDKVDWRTLFAGTSAVMQVMAGCPVHAAEREDCQDDSLHAVERLARESGLPEAEVAQVLCGLAATATATADTAAGQAPAAASAPAHWWGGSGRNTLRRALGLRPALWQPDSPAWRHRAAQAYLLTLALLTAGGVGWVLQHHGLATAGTGLLALAALLLLGPASETVVAVGNRWISESVRPTRLPRLALAGGIPPDHRVLVVVPSLLTSDAGIQALAAQLEQHAIANPQAQAQFALLTDWADADQSACPGDAALLATAIAALETLNRQHPVADGLPPRFLLLHRPRRWSESEQRHIGWERKRGKLEQLLAWLAQQGNADADANTVTAAGPAMPPPFLDLGRLSQCRAGTRYLVTLDGDTGLPPGQLLALVAVAAHPLNQPRLDPTGRRVVAGYGILQPRVVTPLPVPETVTWYHRLFAGQCGLDPYSAASSEIYQDVFGEGTFTGKGLLHVQAMHAVLHGRLPVDQVLSHDLLEGSLLRCAAVSDITVVEDAPVHADVAHSRLHRWTRGDWQLLPFLLHPHRWPMALVNRWKLLDNLRRSLVAPTSLALLLLVLATGVLPPGLALAVVAAAFCAGPLLGAVAGLAPSRDDIALRRFFRLAGADLLRALLTGVWQLAMLLQQALMQGDAIARALWRQGVSRRHLLAWTTAAAAQAAARLGLPELVRQHQRVPWAAGLLALLLGAGAWAGAPVHPAAWPLLAVWAAAPVWIWLVSQPRPPPARARLDTAQRQWLHGMARDTWRYYERHVGAEDNHLPPDNVQMSPHRMVAHRTSPTNIGLYLLVVATAQALGHIGRSGLIQRLQDTLDTLERLPRHRGHFYNWIDTRSLAVLSPAYISTVDSGNCSGHLLVVAQACRALAATPPSPQDWAAPLALSRARLKALAPVIDGSDTLRGLAQLLTHTSLPADPARRQALQALLLRSRAEIDALWRPDTADAETGDMHALWLLQDHVALMAAMLQDADVADAAGTAAQRASLLALADRCRSLALAPDYAMLYDPQRKLLHLGYRVDSQQLDESHYDLLASESRLTSLVAIGKGDVPAAHWAALGRPFFACGTALGLKSWSGSMFEYLMPSLVLDEPIGSVLHQATRSAVRAQQAEALPRGTPWGISESAIAGQDHTLAYQYGPQGVASLALRRTPVDERVVAPYASAMALVVAPVAALENLQALQALGARRSLGFIEAIDYTPQRQVAGSSLVLVHTFMAHHQGMALVAAADVLTDGCARRWARADPVLRATAVLLHERAPREVPQRHEPPRLPAPRRSRGERLVAEIDPLQDALTATQLLGNGRHAVLLRSHGGGHSLWDGLGLTRAQDDLPRSDQGSWFYLQRRTGAPWASLTSHPAPDPGARYSTRMQADRVVFSAEWPDLVCRNTVWVSPEDDCELRELVLCNTTAQPLTLHLVSCAEISLAPLRADEAHPAFSKLFVQAHWRAAEQALFLRRQPRLPGEQAVHAVHFLASSDGAAVTVQPCADRAAWLGRHGSPARPLGPATDPSHALAPMRSAIGDGGSTDHSTNHSTDHGTDHGTQHGSGPGASDSPALDTGLDPVALLRLQVTVPAGSELRLTFCTAASHSADSLDALVDRYRQPSHAARSASMSHTMAGIRLRELGFDTDTWTAMLRLNTLLTAQVHRDGVPQPQPLPGGGMARCDRRVLWRHGLSGDRPIVLLTITSEDGIGLVQTLERAARHWSSCGLGVDLVVVNAEPPSYLSPVARLLQQLQERLRQQTEHMGAALRAGLLVVADNTLQDDERLSLHMLARLRLVADGRSLAQQMDRLVDEHARDAQQRAAVRRLPVLPRWPADAGHLPGQAPAHRFHGPMSDLVFTVKPDAQPARPWINVLANPQFGTQVSEVASGFTWAGNSRMHQITGWSNDPLRDTPAEWLLLHDLDTQRVWPLGQALRSGNPREVTHGLGFSRSTQRLDGLDIHLTWAVDVDAAIKQVQVEIVQAAGRPRRLRLVAVAEWALGSQRSERLSVVTRALWFQPEPAGAGLSGPAATRVLQATQADHLGGFGGATAFLAWRLPQPGEAGAGATAGPEDDWTCDRRELHGTSGAMVLPARLGQAQGAGLDPCAALGIRPGATPGPTSGPTTGAAAGPMFGPTFGPKFGPTPAATHPDGPPSLCPGQPLRLTLLLGHAASAQAATSLLARAWAIDPAQRLAAQQAQWQAMLAPVQVQTPDPAFDALTNHWLPYQTVACRLWARAGFYQAGGAYGFRDQLQDAMAMVSRAPALLAAQLRLNASRQFPQGDVQHWWHAPGGAGVRTHFSDDLLWLPFALALYLARTGDTALLDETVHFLDGHAVPAGQEDLYETPGTSAEQATLYEHAARAIDHSLRLGVHGLPLFGTGDWNDGMNRVGHGGRGESVWLAWFLCSVVDGLLPIASSRGDSDRVARWTASRQGWASALDAAGWDGQWYRRGFFDDGSPLGSAANAECQIDLIAQAWAVLSGAGQPQRARQAMASARQRLVDTAQGVVRLLDPPLQQAMPSAGYIQSYPPGVRENGGQYNHAGVWALMALAQLGEADAAWGVYTLLSPAHRWAAADPQRGPRYALEPHVMAGDVYTQPPWVGRGGWSWYTGAAGWMARAGVESICGVVRSQGMLVVRPALPSHWPEARVLLRDGGKTVQVLVCQGAQQASAALASQPGARSLAAGTPLAWAGLADGQLLVVCQRQP
jgi:cyclic beta-1,2-glucan synthetase